MTTTKTFRGFSLGTAFAILVGCGGGGPDPEPQVVNTPTPPEDKRLSAQFGDVEIGSNAVRGFSLLSTGTPAMNVTAMPELPAPFSIINDNCSSRVLLVGSTCTFDIAFAPTTVGPFMHSFDIPSDAANKTIVTMNGNGILRKASVPPPSAPTDVNATPGDRQVKVQWSTVPDATSYILSWRTATNDKANEIENVTSPYLHTDLTNGEEYRYFVKAKNLSGVSDNSALAVATPLAASSPIGGDWVGIKQFGTNNQDIAYDVAIDNDGNVYVAGYTNGFLHGNVAAGSSDIFLVKYDPTGTKLWSRQIGAANTDVAEGVAVDVNGNVYVAGYTYSALDGNTHAGLSDAFVAKYDSRGTKIWLAQLGTAASDGAKGVAVDVNGNVYLAGYTDGSLAENIHSGSTDAFVAKYDSTGTSVWATQFGTARHDVASSIALDASGYVYVAGWTGGDLDGNAQAGMGDAFVAKYDPAGAGLWTKQFGTVNVDGAESLAVDRAGNVFVTGLAQGTLSFTPIDATGDAFLAKYTSTGTELWIKQFGTASDDYAWDVATDTTGNAYVVGFTEASMDGETLTRLQDAFLIKYNAAGTKLWTRQKGTPDSDIASGVAVDARDNLYIVGQTNGVFDGNVSAGKEDVFIVKYDTGGGG